MSSYCTQPIFDGTVTDFKSFVWRCAKQMGQMVLDRETNRASDWTPSAENIAEISGEIELAYYAEKLRVAKTELKKLVTKDDRIWEKEYFELLDVVRIEWQQQFLQNQTVLNRYLKMLLNVTKWKPPTAAHQCLKDFMLSQLVGEAWTYPLYEPAKEISTALEKHKQSSIDRARSDISHHQFMYDRALERAKERREWIETLIKSLETENECWQQ